MLASGMKLPAVTGTPLSLREPAVGRVVISIRLRALAGLSLDR